MHCGCNEVLHVDIEGNDHPEHDFVPLVASTAARSFFGLYYATEIMGLVLSITITVRVEPKILSVS